MRFSGEIIRTEGDTCGIACHEVFYPGGLRLGNHTHEFPFFGLTMDGSFRETVGQREFEAQPRGVVYHGAGEEHSVAVDRANVRCFVMELDAASIEARYDVRFPPSMLHAQDGPLASLLTSAYREFRYPDASSSLAIQGVVLQLVVTASRTSVADEGRPRWLDRVDELLRERFQSRLTLDEIAAEVGVPAARISSLFRRVHRRSLAEEQRRLRIEFACRQLHDPEQSLAEIALQAGFADQPHFTRTFKTVMGMTPAQYRAVLRP